LIDLQENNIRLIDRKNDMLNGSMMIRF